MQHPVRAPPAAGSANLRSEDGRQLVARKKQPKQRRRQREQKPAELNSPVAIDPGWPVVAAVAAAATLLFGWTLCPTVPFGDGGEHTSGARQCGSPPKCEVASPWTECSSS